MQDLPKLFKIRQKFDASSLPDLRQATRSAVAQTRLKDRIASGATVAVAVGSRGIVNLATIVHQVIHELQSLGAKPFIVPAMGSHGGGTAEGQKQVLESMGISNETMGCEIRSSMETVVVCQAREGFPVHFDQEAFKADHVVVVNRIKPHTRFFGPVESGLMKMLLIGLGKHQGAIVYHRVIQNYDFETIVRSVAEETISKCPIAAGIAILENGYEQTADIVGVPVEEILQVEPQLLLRAKSLLPKLPFDHAELLIVDEIGKNISGSGLDTNVVGRKRNDKAAIDGERPKIHHIYVRGLTETTHGNASGVGIAELIHRRLLSQIDVQKTRINCITAGHISAAAIPVAFDNDRDALKAAISMGGWGKPEDFPLMRIRNTLHLEEVWCSEFYWNEAQNRTDLEILASPMPFEFDDAGDLL